MSRRIAYVLAAVYFVAAYGFVWVVAGPALGSLVVGSAVAFVIVFLGGYAWIGRSALRRRQQALAPTHPGWVFQPAQTTRSQIEAMRATGRRLVFGITVTLGWGPDGLGMWTTRHRQPVEVFAYPWAQVVDATETDRLRTVRGYATPGISIRLADGSAQDVGVAATRALRAAHPGATPAGAVALDIMDTRDAATHA